MRRSPLAVLAALALALGMAGCGSEEGIGQTASAVLVPQVQAVRAAAEQGNRDEALTRLAALRQTVAQLRGTGDLGDQGAATVLEAAVNVERQLALLPAPARTTGPVATTPGVRTDEQRQAEDEARKRAEEAVKKAEEAAKKAEEEAKKRAEDARKRAEEGRKD